MNTGEAIALTKQEQAIRRVSFEIFLCAGVSRVGPLGLFDHWDVIWYVCDCYRGFCRNFLSFTI